MARQRFDILGNYGLRNPGSVEERLAELPSRELDDVRYAMVDLARLTLDRVLWEAQKELAPTIVWAPGTDAASIVAATMFWADHYLVEDTLMSRFVRDPIDVSSLAAALRWWSHHRSLLESGLLVPLPMDVAEVIGSAHGDFATDHDLGDMSLIRWLRAQIKLVEGPSARQAILFQVQDDWNDDGIFYLYAPIDRKTAETTPGGSIHTWSRLLGPYEPDHDYRPWINESRRRAAVSVLRALNTHVAIAHALGAHYLATSPFAARLLQRKRPVATISAGQALAWAGVPTLIHGDPTALAAIVQNLESVEALRLTVRKAFRGMTRNKPDEAAQFAREVIHDISRDAEQLKKKMLVGRKVISTVFGLGIASLGLGAVTAMAGEVGIGTVAAVAGAGVAGVAGLLGLEPMVTDWRINPAYAVLMGAVTGVRRATQGREPFMVAGGFTDTQLTR